MIYLQLSLLNVYFDKRKVKTYNYTFPETFFPVEKVEVKSWFGVTKKSRLVIYIFGNFLGIIISYFRN